MKTVGQILKLPAGKLAGRLGEMGYQPFFDNGSFEQAVDIVGLTVTDPTDLVVASADGSEISYSYADEYMVMAGAQQSELSVQDAEVVFVGYGIQAPEENWDDFKGVNLEGKILLMLNDDPDWDPELFGGERKLYYGRWTYKYEKAAELGAAGAIIIHTTPSAGYPFQVVQTDLLSCGTNPLDPFRSQSKILIAAENRRQQFRLIVASLA